MKKLILFTIIATIFFSPTIALAKGGHGGDDSDRIEDRRG